MFRTFLFHKSHKHTLFSLTRIHQIAKAADAGVRVVCVCLTADDKRPGSPWFDPWLSADSPLDNRTRGMLDRVVSLHPQVLFVIRFYAEQPPGYTGDNVLMLNLTDGDPTGETRIENRFFLLTLFTLSSSSSSSSSFYFFFFFFLQCKSLPERETRCFLSTQLAVCLRLHQHLAVWCSNTIVRASSASVTTM